MKPRPNTRLLLDSLAAMARGAGRPPSSRELLTLSGISEHSVLQFFRSWHAALSAA